MPEFVHKFNDGIDIENAGVHLDIEIENSIKDVKNEKDVQLGYRIKCVKEMLAGEGIGQEGVG